MAFKPLPDKPLDPASRGKFGWDDTDTVFRDEDGKEMTIRQVKEAQLERCRSQVAEDVAADTGAEADD